METQDAANIKSVVLVRPASVTHAFNMEQRLVGLAFTSASGALTVNFPPNSNVAPPGYHMLFLLNNAGVSSVASFVQVSNYPTDQPPKGTITAPPSDVTIKATQSVNFAGRYLTPTALCLHTRGSFLAGPRTQTHHPLLGRSRSQLPEPMSLR